jgi:hypothetical protein
MSLTVYIGGEIDFIFLCDVQDLEIPLGVQVIGDSFGLNVIYELPNTNDTDLSNITKSSIYSSIGGGGGNNSI